MLRPKNHPDGVKAKLAPVGIAGDAVVLIREIYKDCKQAWQGTQNMAHPCSPHGDLFAEVVIEHVLQYWHQCIGGEYRALTCSCCGAFQPSILRDAALQAGEDRLQCDCDSYTREWSCKESFEMHVYLKSVIPAFEEHHRALIVADNEAIESKSGFLDDSWREKFEKRAPELLRPYRTGHASIDPHSPIMQDPEI